MKPQNDAESISKWMKHQMNWIKRSANILVCLSTGEVSWANLTHPIQHSIRFNSINSQLEDASKLLQEIRLKTAFKHFRVESISRALFKFRTLSIQPVDSSCLWCTQIADLFGENPSMKTLQTALTTSLEWFGKLDTHFRQTFRRWATQSGPLPNSVLGELKSQKDA